MLTHAPSTSLSAADGKLNKIPFPSLKAIVPWERRTDNDHNNVDGCSGGVRRIERV